MSKPTKKQMEVLTLMNEGWEMGFSNTMNSRVWLQKNGVGRGGESMDVHINTFNGLHLRGLVRRKEYKFPTSEYVLTDAGREALK